MRNTGSQPVQPLYFSRASACVMFAAVGRDTWGCSLKHASLCSDHWGHMAVGTTLGSFGLRAFCAHLLILAVRFGCIWLKWTVTDSVSHQERKTGLLWFQLHSQNNCAFRALLSCAKLSSALPGTHWECTGLAALRKCLPQGENVPERWLRLLRPLSFRMEHPLGEGSPHQGAKLGGRNESWVSWQPEPKSTYIPDSSSKGMGPGSSPRPWP